MKRWLLVGALVAGGCGGTSDGFGGGGGGGSSNGNGGGLSNGNGGGSGGGSGIAGGGGNSSGARIVTRIVTPGAGVGMKSRFGPHTVGQSAPDGLTNLSYFIVAISVCETLDANGSGFSNPQGCLTLYNNPAPTEYQYMPDMDYSGMAASARTDSDPTHFVNLLDPAARATLESTTSLTSNDAHDYNWGLIGWVPVVKVQAELPIDGGTFYSHDGTSRQGQFGYVTDAATSLTEGPAELATVLHANGGSSFRFQNPLHIDAAALAANQELALDLVFNPEGLIKGFSADTAGPGQLQDAAGNRLATPPLALTPIPHTGDDTVEREAYVMHFDTGGAQFDVRFDLYSLANDPNHTVYGVENQTLYTAGTSDWIMDFPKIMFIEDDSGAGELQFEINPPPGMGGHGPAVVRPIVRTPTGDATVEVDCTDPSVGGFAVPGCDAGSSITVPIEYLGTSPLSP
jgi:hypothetical protein